MFWHVFWLWVYYNAQTIGAATSVLAVIGLVAYCLDTRRIRVATLDQGRASRRPYFHAEEYPKDSPAFNDKDYYQFRNVGAGIAQNVRWKFIDNDDRSPLMPLGSCAVDKVKYLCTPSGHWVDYEEIIAADGIRLEYEDTAGAGYWTLIKFVPMKDDSLYVSVDTGPLLASKLR